MEKNRIHLQSKLFTIDPDLRFAKKRSVPEGLLNEMARRRIVLGYTYEDLQDFYEVKSRKAAIDRKNLNLWLRRVDIYKRAQMAIVEAGTKWKLLQLDPLQYFGENGDFVLLELQKRGNQ